MSPVPSRSAKVLKSRRVSGFSRVPWPLMLHGEADTLDEETELRTQSKAGGYISHRVWAGPALSWLLGVHGAVRQMT